MKLRLRQAHPVLRLQRLNPQQLAAREKVLQRQQLGRLFSARALLEQGRDAAAVPAVFGRGHAGFAKQGLLGIGVGIHVFDRDAQCIQRIERIADVFHLFLWAHEDEFKHGVNLSK